MDKLQEKSPEEKLNAIIEILQTMKLEARFCTADRVRETQDYKKLEAIPKKDLPLHINEHDPDSPSHFIIQCRLSGDDPFEKNLNKCAQILWDQEFDVETYKNIGYNDGLATAVSIIFDTLSMNEDSSNVIEAVYS